MSVLIPPKKYGQVNYELDEKTIRAPGVFHDRLRRLRLRFTAGTVTELDDESNVPDRANEAIYLNLALKIAPSLGKTVSPDLKASAWYAYNNLLSWALSNPRKMSMPDTMPRGAGNKPWRFNSDEYLEQTADPYPPWGET
jgi:hypothetical protein